VTTSKPSSSTFFLGSSFLDFFKLDYSIYLESGSSSSSKVSNPSSEESKSSSFILIS
jgi:hypothetical protein